MVCELSPDAHRAARAHISSAATLNKHSRVSIKAVAVLADAVALEQALVRERGEAV
jgi:hypothetical protein